MILWNFTVIIWTLTSDRGFFLILIEHITLSNELSLNLLGKFSDSDILLFLWRRK